MISKRKHLVRNTIILVVLLLLFTEIAVRILFFVKGYTVGKLAPEWMVFQQMDTLVEQQSFFTDEHGIYKMKRDYWEKQGYKVNNENFRGREFASDTLSDSISILFIGDSFVWGFHADPIDSCFVDLIDNDSRFTCYNAGIPGTDPAQYAAVAETYVPQIHPDYTVVAVYLGNDLMSESRAIVPNEELWYQTNAGWLPASYKGKHFASAKESYDYITDKYAPKTLWKKLLLKSALGTAILSLPLRIEEYSEWNKKTTSTVTNDYLKRIKMICDKNNSRLFVFLIPGLQTDLSEEFFKDSKSYLQHHYPALMSGMENEMFVLPVKKEFYYPAPDGHLNNQGHRAVADFIRSKILSATPP